MSWLIDGWVGEWVHGQIHTYAKIQRLRSFQYTNVIKVTCIFVFGTSVFKCKGVVTENERKTTMNERKEEGSKKCEVQSSLKLRLIIFNVMQKTNSYDYDRGNNLITDLACRTSLKCLCFGWSHYIETQHVCQSFMYYTVQSLMKFILVFCSQTELPILKLIESRFNIANRYDVMYQSRALIHLLSFQNAE